MLRQTTEGGIDHGSWFKLLLLNEADLLAEISAAPRPASEPVLEQGTAPAPATQVDIKALLEQNESIMKQNDELIKLQFENQHLGQQSYDQQPYDQQLLATSTRSETTWQITTRL